MMKIFNLIFVMNSGYVHQVRIKAIDWAHAKDMEMTLLRTMMNIDFWRQINHTILLEIKKGTKAPHYSINYNEFLKEIKSLGGHEV